MFWTKNIWPNVIQDIILFVKFMLDKNVLDKPILDKMTLDEVLFSPVDQDRGLVVKKTRRGIRWCDFSRVRL